MFSSNLARSPRNSLLNVSIAAFRGPAVPRLLPRATQTRTAGIPLKPKPGIFPRRSSMQRRSSRLMAQQRRVDQSPADEDTESPASSPNESTLLKPHHPHTAELKPLRHFQLCLGSWRGPEVPLRPELLAISIVYLVQGLLGLSRLAVFTFFKDDLLLDPATVGILSGLAMVPWMIKPLYGFLSDSVPLFGYRRRSYLLVCGAAGALSWAALGSGGIEGATPAMGALILGSAATACADVVADSIVVELSRGEPQSTAGSLQSLCWASASVGAVLSSYFSGSLVQDYGPRPVFLLTAIFPLLVAAAAAAIPEERTTYAPGVTNWKGAAVASKKQAVALWGAMSQRSIWIPALFVFCWQATPTADTAMLFFETNSLGFSTEFLGRIRLVASVASLAGVAVYNFALKATPLRKMFLWTAIAGTGLGMTQLALITGANRAWGISDDVFALGDSALLTVLGQVSFMPVLVLAARMCPEGVEATLFATLMSILNGGAFVGSALGSGLTKAFGVSATEFDNLAPLVALCTLLTLAPLPLLLMLPETMDATADAAGKEKKEEERYRS